MDEAKSMITVGKYNENIVNLQGVCFDKPYGRNLRNVSVLFNYLLFPNKELYNYQDSSGKSESIFLCFFIIVLYPP